MQFTSFIDHMKTKLFSSRKETENAKETDRKESGTLDRLEEILEFSQKHGIEQCLEKEKKQLDYVTRTLGVTPLQAVLFAHFMGKSQDCHISVSDIANSIKCSQIRIIKYINECDELEKKKLIRCRRCDDGDIIFRVPYEVQDALRKNNTYTPQKRDGLSIHGFFTVLRRLFTERSNNELFYDTLHMELQDVMQSNMHLPFCQKITGYKLGANDQSLFLCFCHLAVNRHDNNIRFEDIEFIFDDEIDICSENIISPETIKDELADGTNDLFKKKLIEHNNSGGFIDSDSIKVTDNAKEELLSEFKLVRSAEKKQFKNGLITCDSIKSKKMFYNPKESESIAKLTALLRDEQYRKVQERLTGKGMRKGFACLFCGPPGTGKTETAYQIARETGRDLMMVDIAETKSCWYGESEKKIKAVFDTYRKTAEDATLAPILLFNEADAVIGKRKEIGDANRSIDQTENTIQNIILQEMENLEGIMIATTNLIKNMDSAFERRFLYKISFEKPNAESRRGIWRVLMPNLPENMSAELSEKFELSGGQIENIARKTEIDAIINGSEFSLETLMRYGKDETLNSLHTAKKIGF